MLEVRASYYDASAARWYDDVINRHASTSSSLHGVNFNDGFHLASSITSDSEYYGIRRFRVGTLATYGQELPVPCPATLSPSSASVGGRRWRGHRRRRRAGRLPVDGGEQDAVADDHRRGRRRRPGVDRAGARSQPVDVAAHRAPSRSPAAPSTSRKPGAPSSPPEPLPTVGVGDVIVAEGAGTNTTAMFAVTLSAPSAQTVTVGYATADGTALAGSDYVSCVGDGDVSAGRRRRRPCRSPSCRMR